MTPRHPVLLALGVVAVSFSSILIRWAEAPALSIAFYRNAMAAAVLLPLALARQQRGRQPLLGLVLVTPEARGCGLAPGFALQLERLGGRRVPSDGIEVGQPLPRARRCRLANRSTRPTGARAGSRHATSLGSPKIAVGCSPSAAGPVARWSDSLPGCWRHRSEQDRCARRRPSRLARAAAPTGRRARPGGVSRAERRLRVREEALAILRAEGHILPQSALARVINEVSDAVVGLGPIEFLLKDPDITEVIRAK